VAVLLVLLAHSTVAFPYIPFFRWVDSYGSLGVQLFFVLSGFLITKILLESKSSSNFFRNFYMRRALRIYPLYYALLAFVMFSGVVHQHGVRWWPYALYLSNLTYAHGTQPAPLGPVWSLAVEEQFYIVWPFLVAGLSRRNLERVCLVTIAGAICLRLSGAMQLHNTLVQLDALAAGGLVACRFDQIAIWRPFSRWVACLLPLGINLPAGHWNNLSQTLQVVGSVALLIVLLEDKASSSQIFRFAPLRFAGKVSYGVYLLHSLIFATVLRSGIYHAAIATRSLPIALLCLAIEFAAAFGIAALSFYFFESPFLRLKRYFNPVPAPANPASRESTQAIAPEQALLRS
jgi:peptidoglycan/LPS O-acetylase OafA/YrhL